MQSDSETNVSNASGYIRYDDKHLKLLYISMLRNLDTINQDVLEVERNMKNIISQAGPLEGQLSALLQALPKPSIPAELMDTTSASESQVQGGFCDSGLGPSVQKNSNI